MLLTQMRPHSYSKRYSDTMFCPHCNKNKAENSKHFIILCPHCTVMRRTLFDMNEQEFIANFKGNCLEFRNIGRQQITLN